MTSAVLDHIWQSTLLALGVGLLTVAFQRARADVRHALWFVASAKFLVPFAALAALGRVLAPAVGSPVYAAPETVFIERATQPFSQSFATGPAVFAAPHVDPAQILAAVWAVGCAAVVLRWMVRWARVNSIVLSAAPASWPGPMPVLASSSLLEPGLVGFWRPVLLVPKALPEHLSQPEIDAIVAHEACHLLRRDNLTAAIHMLVEAVFWFHPLVWWIGARLIEERERACDEAVVRSGHDRAAYARSLVETCRLYLQSPLPCVAGASGSNLKKRVEMIMTAPPSSPLSPLNKTLLIAAGVCAFASPVAAGILTSGARLPAAAPLTMVAATSPPAGVSAPRSSDRTPAATFAPRRSSAARAFVLARSEASYAPDPSVARIDVSAPASAQVDPAPPAERAQPGPGAEDAVRREDTSSAVKQTAGQQEPPPKQIIRSPQAGGAAAAKPLESDCYIVFGELRCGQTTHRVRR